MMAKGLQRRPPAVICTSLILYEAQSFASEPALARIPTRSKQFGTGVVCRLSDRA